MFGLVCLTAPVVTLLVGDTVFDLFSVEYQNTRVARLSGTAFGTTLRD